MTRDNTQHVLLVFPHQLYQDHPGLEHDPSRVVLIEDSLFFGDWNYSLKFHQQKLWLHRASMKRYEAWLQQQGWTTDYVEYDPDDHSLSKVVQAQLKSLRRSRKSKDVCFYVSAPDDFILEKRLAKACSQPNVTLELCLNPGFLNTPIDNDEYRSGKKRWFMADFYRWQRRRLDWLMDQHDQPVGGKWSFDAENRKKIPKAMLDSIPELPDVEHDEIDQEAVEYVSRRFGDHPGDLETLIYPTSHDGANEWLGQFLEKRLPHFGDYEDAIEQDETWLWHSVLTPMLNIGLLTPSQILQATESWIQGRSAINHPDVPLNSLEGFIRQIIGWREFMRATYQDLGVQMRTQNHWGHHNQIPASFYDGTTGIEPVDNVIQRLLKTGYCHHIERLMVLGGFMFLCEFHPKEIYRWFMEMFVDSYDWVMVPNVYAMSQHAEGGLITTKPYFSGSSYVRKMSHYKKGDWCDTWDGLYWRWVLEHAEALQKNPRWAMMCSMAKKMSAEKQATHRKHADAFLQQLKPVSP